MDLTISDQQFYLLYIVGKIYRLKFQYGISWETRPKANKDVRTVLDVRPPCDHVMAWAMWGTSVQHQRPSVSQRITPPQHSFFPPTHSLSWATWVSHMCCHTLSEHRWGYIRLTISPKEPMRQDFVMSANLATVSGLGAHAVEKIIFCAHVNES